MPNSTVVTWPEPERSPCMVGIFPVVYYSVLLGLGLPGEVLGAARVKGAELQLPPDSTGFGVWGLYAPCSATRLGVTPAPLVGATAAGTDGTSIAGADTWRGLISSANPHGTTIFIVPQPPLHPTRRCGAERGTGGL